jgi:hypothetical protein
MRTCILPERLFIDTTKTDNKSIMKLVGLLLEYTASRVT